MSMKESYFFSGAFTPKEKLIEEMAELDRRVVIDTPTDNDEDEGNNQGMIW